MPRYTQDAMPLVFAAFVVLGCANSKTPDPVGGETHFLEGCDSQDACGIGLECVCGVCTKPCVTDNTCKDENASATCETAGTPSGACDNPLTSPVCDVKCTLDSECTTLGATYTCESGSCRKLSTGSCIAGGVVYADGDQYSLDGCNSCLCNNGTFNCTGVVCDDGGIDAGSDSAVPDAEVDAQVGDAEVDATESFPIDTGLVAAADQPCDVDAGVGVFIPKEMDPVPTCVELDDLTAIPGSQMLAFSAGIQTSTHNDTDIYSVSGSDVYRIAKSGDAPLQFGSFERARSLLVDGCHLYLAEGDMGGVLGSKSLADGSDTTLAWFPDADQSVSDIVADDEHLYVFTDNALQRVPRSGGAIVTMARRRVLAAGGYDFPVLTATDTDLYWLDGESADGAADRVMTMPKVGDARPRVVASQLARPIHIHWRNGFLYVLNDGNRDALGNYTGGGGLIRINPSNGAVETLDTFSGATDLASDDQHVYWIRELASTYSVSRIPITGSANPTPLFANLRGRGRGLMVDASSLYWQSECWGTGFSSSFIVRVPKPIGGSL